MFHFCKFYQNDQFFNSFIMYSNSSAYNYSYMDSIDSKIPPIDFKLGEEGIMGDGIKFQDNTSQFSRE